MQKLMILAALVAGLLLTFPMQSGAEPTCVVNNDAGQTTCVVNVKGHGNPTSCEASDEAFTTIQDAVDFLPDVPSLTISPVRTILVCPGPYSTDAGGSVVNVNKGAVTIISTDGPRFTRISGVFRRGFYINAHRVTIQGFTVVGGQPEPGGTENTGIFITFGEGNKVLDNVVHDAVIGICVGGASNADSNQVFGLRNIVQGNLVHHNQDGIVLSSDIPRTPPGENIPPGTQSTVGCENGITDRTIITHNTVWDNRERGVLVYQGEGNSLEDNTIHDNETGIAISSPGLLVAPINSNILHNTVRNNRENGIAVYRGSSNSLVGNTVHDNKTGIAIPSPEGTEFTIVEANSVHDNHTGIVDQDDTTRCDGNNIRDNGAGNPPQGACASEDNQLVYINRNSHR